MAASSRSTNAFLLFYYHQQHLCQWHHHLALLSHYQHEWQYTHVINGIHNDVTHSTALIILLLIHRHDDDGEWESPFEIVDEYVIFERGRREVIDPLCVTAAYADAGVSSPFTLLPSLQLSPELLSTTSTPSSAFIA
ncbi:hypothetical protein ONZ45_g17557 [Pleurotus djamor]|nr:hypothetical protein ONZ45_g17557 [Pleurotus djamor]